MRLQEDSDLATTDAHVALPHARRTACWCKVLVESMWIQALCLGIISTEKVGGLLFSIRHQKCQIHSFSNEDSFDVFFAKWDVV